MEARLLWAETIRTPFFPGSGLGCKGWGWGGRALPVEGALVKEDSPGMNGGEVGGGRK